jgi:hypothetical protein
MPDSNANAVAATTASPKALRIVLFGMPDAGKSSLLGALAQAGQIQEHLLNGHLTDLSQGLADLQQRLYEERPVSTLAEVVPYAIAFEPFTTPPRSAATERVQAVLVDCDGRVANELLTRRRALNEDSAEGSLARAILEADALILVVDASANPTQIESDFAEFGRFLRLLEQNRGRRSEVGGLPVFLVLTKCDLLAAATDSPSAWKERIEERQHQVNAHFQEFLARPTTEGPLRFGRIELELAATAVKQPALANTPAKPREPYGIAELFRHSFDAAQTFRERRQESSRRLRWTVAGSASLVAGMLSLAAVLWANRPDDTPNPLQASIDRYRSREGPTSSVRLRGDLQPRISELIDLKGDAHFDRLSPQEQQYIQERLQELQEYRAYRDKLERIPSAETARSERDLEEISRSLHELVLPPQRQHEWGATQAVLERLAALEEIKALRDAVSQVEDWYRQLVRRGDELWTFSASRSGEEGPIAWRDWQGQVQNLFDQAETPSFRAIDKLPSSARLTYAVALRFDRVAEARNAWEAARGRLQRLRDLSTALGLAAAPAGSLSAVLDLPPAFTADQARTRVQELEKQYPRFQHEFSVAGLPDVVVGEIRRAARSRYERVLVAGREVVLRHLQELNPDGRETLSSWQSLRAWINNNPGELQAWRVLATVLARLHKPDSEEPVLALAAFLSQEHFDLEMRRLQVEIPDDLRVRPVGQLSIYQRPGEQNRPTLIYELTGDPQRDPRRQVTTYAMRPAGPTTLTYRPGDTLWAELPLKDAENRDWLFTWARSRSQVYQLERLVRPPRLHRRDQANTEGKIAEGVSLNALPEHGIPSVPDLMPVVRLEKSK